MNDRGLIRFNWASRGRGWGNELGLWKGREGELRGRRDKAHALHASLVVLDCPTFVIEVVPKARNLDVRQADRVELVVVQEVCRRILERVETSKTVNRSVGRNVVNDPVATLHLVVPGC